MPVLASRWLAPGGSLNLFREAVLPEFQISARDDDIVPDQGRPSHRFT
jgi:hypothetical protein